MDKESITKLIKETPSPVVKLVMEGNYQPLFILNGVVEAINSDSIIFRTKQQTSAISFKKILEIVLTDRREL